MRATPVLLPLLTAFALFGCDAKERDCPDRPDAASRARGGDANGGGRFMIDNAFYYDQVSGSGEDNPTLAYVLFEHPLDDVVKYQVAYVACTCRGAAVNYHSVAYVELSRTDGSVVFMSYGADSGGHYTPGTYGDSTETGRGTPVKALFERFKDEKLVGATQDEIYAIEPMHGEVDVYSGATVTPNNAVRMLQGLFGYHNARYM